MSVKNTHPDYDNILPDLVMLRDFYQGERVVKTQTTTYLKPTIAQSIDGINPGQDGYANYQKYLEGARFPDLIKQAVENALGLMHKEDATIEVPDKMLPLLDKITRQGESVFALLRRINEEQLTVGRLGLLLDSDEKTDQPYISLYYGEAITNWDEGFLETGAVSNLNLVILNEPSTTLNDDFQWTTTEKYRVCMVTGDENGNDVMYRTGVFEDKFDKTQLKPVTIMGRGLEKIPFVFINAKDLLATPDIPPLLGLAYKVLGIYRSEANYRYHLYMQSQDTLVRIGHMPRGIDDQQETESVRTGAGAVIDVDTGGDAKYIGVNSTGLSEERQALENDYAQAEVMAIKMIEKGNVESNEALTTRKSAQTVSMTQIAKTSAAALEEMLKKIAVWMNLDPKKVKVTAFTDFADKNITPADVVSMQTAKSMGAILSQETIHDRMRDGGLTKKTLEDELAAIAKEDDPITKNEEVI
jgi:hypothetical protein